MSEIDELRKQLEAAQNKIELLEETIETLKSMNRSEEIQQYISKQQMVMNITSLLNSVSAEQINLNTQELALSELKNEKALLDEKIKAAIKKSDEFLDNNNYSQYFEYRPYKNGVEITSYIGFDDEKIIVPQTISGLPVLRIGDKVFEGYRKLESITLPDVLEELGDYAFRSCESLKNIKLPKSLKMIGKSCFMRCGLTEIYINISILPSRCFMQCRNLKSVIIGSNTKEINFHAFTVTKLEFIIIPETVSKISRVAFDRRIIGIAFLGMHTNLPSIPDYITWEIDEEKSNYTIYCLPGSDAQKYARQHHLEAKPLNEFPGIQEV